MKLNEAPDWARSALAGYETFRRLEFSRDEIFFQFIQKDGDPNSYFAVTLQKPVGNIIFFLIIDDLQTMGGNAEAVNDIFAKAITAWNDPAQREDCAKLWKEQMDAEQFLAICLDMNNRKLINLDTMMAKKVWRKL